MKGLIAALLLLASSALAADDYPYYPEFDFACKIIHADCSNLSPPTVVVTSLYWNAGGIFGAFSPDSAELIWIDGDVLPQLGIRFNAVIAHEMTHYIDYHLGTMEFVVENRCPIEARGWIVYNAWLTANGRHDMRDTTWQEHYGC